MPRAAGASGASILAIAISRVAASNQRANEWHESMVGLLRTIRSPIVIESCESFMAYWLGTNFAR